MVPAFKQCLVTDVIAVGADYIRQWDMKGRWDLWAWVLDVEDRRKLLKKGHLN